jgi:uncharacterized membrane protein
MSTKFDPDRGSPLELSTSDVNLTEIESLREVPDFTTRNLPREVVKETNAGRIGLVFVIALAATVIVTIIAAAAVTVMVSAAAAQAFLTALGGVFDAISRFASAVFLPLLVYYFARVHKAGKE